MTDPATLRAFAEDRLRQLRARREYAARPIASIAMCEWCQARSPISPCRRCRRTEKK